MHTSKYYDDIIKSFNSFQPTLPNFSSSEKTGESFIFYYGSKPFESKPFFDLNIQNLEGSTDTYASGCICSTTVVSKLSLIEERRDRVNYCEFKSVIPDDTRILLFNDNPFVVGKSPSLTETTMAQAKRLYEGNNLRHSPPFPMLFILPEESCVVLQKMPYAENLSMELGDLARDDEYLAKFLHSLFCKDVRDRYNKDLYLKYICKDIFRLCFTDLIYLELNAVKDLDNVVTLRPTNLDWIEKNISISSVYYSILKNITKEIQNLNQYNGRDTLSRIT